MKILVLGAAATLIASSGAYAQAIGAPAPTLPTVTQGVPVAAPLDLDIPQITGTSQDPTCGGRSALTQQAFCIQTTQAAMQTVADQYDAAFQKQGWLAAGGADNRTVYVKRKEGGGCTGFQLMAFADETRQAAPGTPGYFAFATIPGDVCTALPASAPAATPIP